MKVVFFGDGRWASDSAEALLTGDDKIVGLVLRVRPSSSDLEDFAQKKKLTVLQPQKVNDPQFRLDLMKLKPDLGISLSYNQILGAELLKLFPKGVINFHAGKLPFYRGCNVINWAIINGEKELGLTAHFVDEGIDTGDIILQRTISIAWTDTYGTVLQNAVASFPDLVRTSVNMIRNGQAPRTKQSHLMGSYFCRRRNGDEWLDWTDTSKNLYNKIRAITRPGPGARTLLRDQALVIWSAEYDPAWPAYLGNPGEIIGQDDQKGFLVKTGDSVLLINDVAMENLSCKPVRLKLGARFTSK
jgi:methionyl-tRNA formyltransferase